MTKQYIRYHIKKDRLTTRGMRWKLEVDGNVYVAFGSKTDAINYLYEKLS